jgi:FAS-associated factor 2
MWACSKQLPEGKKVHGALKSRRCPFIGLIVLRSNKMTLVSRIEGPIKPAELLIQLSNIFNDYHDDLALARIERESYNETQRLREQQDQAYAECLRQDQEKAKKQRELDLAKKLQEEEEHKQIENEKRKLEVCFVCLVFYKLVGF